MEQFCSSDAGGGGRNSAVLCENIHAWIANHVRNIVKQTGNHPQANQLIKLIIKNQVNMM